MEMKKKDIDLGLEIIEDLNTVSKESWNNALDETNKQNEDEYEEVEVQDEDVDSYYVTDIHINCPKCNHIYDEYNIVYETEYKCICEKCGHKFSFYYCPY